MAEKHALKYVAFGITNCCSHNCEFCYETAFLKQTRRRHGNLATLKRISEELAGAGVEFIELVGGDPAEHPQIGELTRFLCEDLGLGVGILSNTHKSWEQVAPFVTALEWTVHGPQDYHDAFTRPGTYQAVLDRLKGFAKAKKSIQQIGLTINFTPIMAEKLYGVVHNLAQELPVDYVQLQRIGPFGGASGGHHALKLEDVLAIYRQIKRIDEEMGIGIEVVDSYPLCLLPEDLRKYTARCDWGYGTAYVDMDGNLSRCAVNQILLDNVIKSEEPLSRIWAENPSLVKFREKKYLPKKCQQCELLEQCGGGCPSSCGGCDLSGDQLIVQAAK